jgi:hypothetical protein
MVSFPATRNDRPSCFCRSRHPMSAGIARHRSFLIPNPKPLSADHRSYSCNNHPEADRSSCFCHNLHPDVEICCLCDGVLSSDCAEIYLSCRFCSKWDFLLQRHNHLVGVANYCLPDKMDANRASDCVSSYLLQMHYTLVGVACCHPEWMDANLASDCVKSYISLPDWMDANLASDCVKSYLSLPDWMDANLASKCVKRYLSCPCS